MSSALPADSPMVFGWSACGASVTGREHLRRGLGCDDAYGFGIAGDLVVAVVADGAGSVTGTSAWGSYAACQSVLDDALRPDFADSLRRGGPDHAEELMRWIFERALERVTRQAAALGLDVSLLATTLCVAVADRHQAVFGQIGDGVIAAELHGQIATLLIERKADYANTTSFLQSERALEVSLRTTVCSGVSALALSTDGMSYKITDVATGEAYEPFFRDCWKHVRVGASAEQFAELLRSIEDDQTGDDKTMVLVASGGPASAGADPVGAEPLRRQSGPPTWPVADVGARQGDELVPWTDAETVPLAQPRRRGRHRLRKRQH